MSLNAGNATLHSEGVRAEHNGAERMAANGAGGTAGAEGVVNEMDGSTIHKMTVADRHLNVVLTCPDCRSSVPNIIEEFASGDLVCGDCGLVLGDRIIDTRSEWRTFANDEGDDPSRVGAASNPFLDGPQLDTIIARIGDGGSGLARDLNKIHGKNTAQKYEKTLVLAYKEISAICEMVDLPKIILDVAKQIYKIVADKKVFKGKNIETIATACVFVACRQEKVPRTFKEVVAMTRVPKKDIGRVVKKIQKMIETKVESMTSTDLLSRFCSNMKLGMDVQRLAGVISEKSKDISTLAGKSPLSIAAACIYFVSHILGDPRDYREINKISGVSEVTIRNTYKSLLSEVSTIITEDVIKSHPKINVSNLPTA